jgi:hypothetical protein
MAIVLCFLVNIAMACGGAGVPLTECGWHSVLDTPFHQSDQFHKRPNVHRRTVDGCKSGQRIALLPCASFAQMRTSSPDKMNTSSSVSGFVNLACQMMSEGPFLGSARHVPLRCTEFR